jgi:hypothetical protein
MLIALGLLVLAGDTVSGKLVGENVCQEEQRYTINVTEYFVRNSTARNYKWCMNVPPRCSFYTTRLINESRIVEKEVADLIDKCCSGYVEDSGKCTPVCPDCVNGTCVAGTCSCFPGYKGELCDAACDAAEWGENCENRCACESCDPVTGECVCPAGWTGSRCQSPCPYGFYGLNCQTRCNCDSPTACNPITGECEATFATLSSPRPTKKSTKPHTIKIFKSNSIPFKNNGKFEIDNNFISTTPVFETTETPFSEADHEDNLAVNQMAIDNYMSGGDRDGRRYVLTTVGPAQIVKSSKAKVKEKEVSTSAGEENYLGDDGQRGYPEVYKNDLVNGASAATAISVGIIILAVVIVAAHHFKRSKTTNKSKGGGSKGVSTVAVYTHSIFHTPLPEPPTFENPVFVSPTDQNSTSEGQRFETHVVCSMNFPSLSGKDPREYLYDHPPSTGSYRAASIPEPPDIDSIKSVTQCEPLYDEIPSGMVPTPVSESPPLYKSPSLYMNTCGKTRF